VFSQVPQLTYLSHVNRAVEARINRTFKEDTILMQEENEALAQETLKRWHRVIYASTVEECLKESEQLLSYCEAQGESSLSNYFWTQWLKQSKRQRFCVAWTRKDRHFDTVSTSALEGLHRTVKDWLHSATHDLNSVVEACWQSSTSHLFEIQDSMASQAVRVPAQLRLRSCPIIPQRLTQRITHQALIHLV
jgi:hypothetical protein